MLSVEPSRVFGPQPLVAVRGRSRGRNCPARRGGALLTAFTTLASANEAYPRKSKRRRGTERHPYRPFHTTVTGNLDFLQHVHLPIEAKRPSIVVNKRPPAM